MKLKTAFPKIYNLASVVLVAIFGSSTTVYECGFFTLTRMGASKQRSMLLPRQRNLVLVAFERDRTRKIDLDAFVSRFNMHYTRLRLF